MLREKDWGFGLARILKQQRAIKDLCGLIMRVFFETLLVLLKMRLVLFVYAVSTCCLAIFDMWSTIVLHSSKLAENRIRGAPGEANIGPRSAP